MKFFIVLALTAVAMAEPEADPQFAYNAYPYVVADVSPGLARYPNGAVAPIETPSVQLAKAQHFAAKATAYANVAPYVYGAHYIGKREAEAAPDAQIYAGYPYAATYGTYGAYGAYAGYPSTYATYGAHFIGKREAEADAQFYAGYPYATTAFAGYPSTYANYGFVNTLPYTRYIGKREAEAEPKSQFYGGYGLGYPTVGYNTYGYSAFPYGAYGRYFG